MSKKTGKNINCKTCNKEFYVSAHHLKKNKQFCGMVCYAKHQEEHPSNTGRTWLKKGNVPKNKANGSIRKDGYRAVCYKDHQVLEHDLIYCLTNGFYYIPKGYVVHHLDQNKLNNNPENLALLPRGFHTTLHRLIESRQLINQGEL